MRKNEIRDYISQQLNWAGQPMPTGDQVRERVSQLPELPAWTLAMVAADVMLFRGAHRKVSSDG